MKLEMRGTVALVTGSSRGIGRAIALTFADQGCDVLLTGRDGKALLEVAEAVRERGRKAHVVVVDLNDECATGLLVDTVRSEFGGLDILVNNAGTTQRGDFFSLTDRDWQDGFALKFFAHVRLTRAAWPLLAERHGSLITIAGMSGRLPDVAFTIGSSVNAACAAFSKSLSELGKKDGVQVNCINPSLVETDRLWRQFKREMEATGKSEAEVRAARTRAAGLTRFGTPEDVASMVAYVASKEGSWLHGATIDLDGGRSPAL
jgi:3-oxoacyl-[acyl-carrier protein] reductase